MDSRLGAVALAALAAASLACGGKPAEGPGAGGPGGAGRGAPAVPVKVQTVADTDLKDGSEYLATVKSRRSVNVQPQVEGVVSRIFVRSGDRVAAGAPLLQIDPAKQRAAVASQQATRQAKRAALEYAREQKRRLEVLYKGGAVAKQALDEAESALGQAQADYDAVGAQVEEQAVELRYYRVTAPEAGIVGDVPVRVGDRVTTSTLLTTLDANDAARALEVYVSVPLERAKDLRLGLPVEIAGDGGRVVATSAVDFIAPQVDEATQSVLVKAPVASGQGLRAAQLVRARLIWSSHRGAVIPVLAVTRVSGQYFAFVAEPAPGAGADGTGFVARQRPLQLGEVVGDDYVVKSGLKPGERVIVSGVQKLGDGAPVAPS